MLRRRVLAGAALIVLTTSLAYFPSLKGGFILDDNLYLTENHLVAASDGLYKFWCTTEPVDYYPVSNTTLWLEWRLWGMHPTGYHVTNLALHIIEALLIWAIVQRLSIAGAFLAALLFAVHPVNVESVAWVAQRKGVLAMLFLLLTILWYLKAETDSQPQSRSSPPLADRWYGLSLAAFVLAMLSKGSVAMLPALLLCIVWWLRPLTKRDVVRAAPFFLIAAILVGVNVWFQTRSMQNDFRHAAFVERLLGAGGVVWFYLYKALLPVNLVFIYPQWQIHEDQILWWVPLLATGATTCVLWWYRQGWSRPLLCAWGLFCLALVPVMGFTDVGFMRYSLVADHYQHVALIAVVVLVAAAWGRWQHRVRGATRWVPNAAAAILVGGLTFLTWRQNQLYSNPIALYEATLERNPDASIVHNNLGNALRHTDRLADQIEHYEQALRLKPDSPEAHNNLGNALTNMGRLPEAIRHFEQALQLKPDYIEAHSNLGSVLRDTGRLPEALEQYEEALRLKPDFPEGHNNLGNALAAAGRLPEAIEHFEQALRLKPDYVVAHLNLGNALAQLGQPQAAIGQYEQALQLKPDDPEAQNSLGLALAESGQLQRAVEHYKEAVRLRPSYADAYNNMGNALGRAGQLQEAIEAIGQALRLQPDDPEAHNNMGSALAQAGRLPEAIEHFQQALRLKPDYPDAQDNLQMAVRIMQKAADR